MKRKSVQKNTSDIVRSHTTNKSMYIVLILGLVIIILGFVLINGMGGTSRVFGGTQREFSSDDLTGGAIISWGAGSLENNMLISANNGFGGYQIMAGPPFNNGWTQGKSSGLWLVTTVLGDRSWGVAAGDINAKNNNFRIMDITADKNRMVIDTNGRIGIGTSSPTQILDVNGVVKTNGIEINAPFSIGSGNKVGGNAIVIGKNSIGDDGLSGQAFQSLAIGSDVEARVNSVAVGVKYSGSKPTRAIGPAATAIGPGAEALSAGTTAIGINSVASDTGSIAIGDNSRVSGNQAIGIGASTNTRGHHGIALGTGAVSSGLTSIAIGSEADAQGDNAVAMGRSAVAQANQFVVGNPNFQLNMIVNGKNQIKGTLTVDALNGTGNAYACVRNDGTFFRSQTPCV